MHRGFRPLLEPPSQRRATTIVRRIRPVHCLTVTVVTVLLVVLVFGVSAWNVYFHRFGNNGYDFIGGDEVALSEVADDFSATFCDGFTVSLKGPGEVYLLPHHATVNTTITYDTHVEIHQLPYRETNVVFAYLLKKSSVNVTVCRNNAPVSPDAEVVFIQGDKNFRQWRRDNYCDNCILDRIKIPHDAYCYDTTSPRLRLYHEVDSNDKYFLAIFNGRPDSRNRLVYSGIFLQGVLSRTHFDLSDAKKICRVGNSSCHFDLPWMTNKDAVIKFEKGDRKMFSDNLTTRCHERVIFWVWLFGLFPVVCIIITVTSFGCFMRRWWARSGMVTRGRQGERTPLLHAEDKQFTNHVPQNEENGRMAIQFT